MRPWCKLGIDLCYIDGKTFVIIIDYFSNFFEFEEMNRTTAYNVTMFLRK